MEETVLDAKEALVTNIQLAQKQKESLTLELEELKKDIESLEQTINEKKDILLTLLRMENLKEFKYGGNTAALFSRENIGYTSDADVLKWLKENGYSNFVKTKVTESLDKTPLKKAIKADPALASALENMTVKTTTEYVVVTEDENYQKMLEHINEGKDK